LITSKSRPSKIVTVTNPASISNLTGRYADRFFEVLICIEFISIPSAADVALSRHTNVE